MGSLENFQCKNVCLLNGCDCIYFFGYQIKYIIMCELLIIQEG
jgi:hypothetical protein